jgi:hypothetical protein
MLQSGSKLPSVGATRKKNKMVHGRRELHTDIKRPLIYVGPVFVFKYDYAWVGKQYYKTNTILLLIMKCIYTRSFLTENKARV